LLGLAIPEKFVAVTGETNDYKIILFRLVGNHPLRLKHEGEGDAKSDFALRSTIRTLFPPGDRSNDFVFKDIKMPEGCSFPRAWMLINPISIRPIMFQQEYIEKSYR
jgi:hypothetical protein